jgi:dihydrodipicolinate synthase/N-acetylneuraminate lyase
MFSSPLLSLVDFVTAPNIQQRIPTLAGVKYIDPDMTTLIKATGAAKDSFVFFNNDPLLAGMAAGSMGAISYTTIFPYVSHMRAAFEANDMATARDLQRTIFFYDDIVGKYGGKPAARVLPQLFGGFTMGPPRAPLVEISPSDLIGLNASLVAAGFMPDGIDHKDL